MKKTILLSLLFLSAVLSQAQQGLGTPTAKGTPSDKTKPRPEIYAEVRLTTDMTQLTEEEKQVLVLLIQAAEVMDQLFWMEAYGERGTLLKSIADPGARRFAEINYGPWDRLDGNKVFVPGVEAKPDGANFYPADMKKEEFEQWGDPLSMSPYTMIRRDEKGGLRAIWYHDFFKDQLSMATKYLLSAAEITTDKELKLYLEERAKALLTDQYKASDIAWLQMRNNHLDIIIGPIENYEDKLFGYKSAHEAYVLVKDKKWSERLDKYTELLPKLQAMLPVPDEYKQDEVGSESQLAAYDVVFYAGDCNSGSKTIAVNLPNDEELQTTYGTRRSQLKNAMQAKYEKILVPISGMLIDPKQQRHITFNAFFSNVMFHEVAHGLGIKKAIDGSGTVSEKLREQHAALEEEKADVLGLWLITQLFDMKMIEEGELMDHYVTFIAGIFRSCRFGASSAHGKANMHTFNYLLARKAFVRSPEGYYSVNMELMRKAIDELAGEILRLQGDGNYEEVKTIMVKEAVIGEELAGDLARINAKGIPVDVIFDQGVGTLGLKGGK